MTLTDLQEILVIMFGGVIFLISLTWTLVRIRNYILRQRRPRPYSPPVKRPLEAEHDEEDKPPVDCQWR